MSAERLDVHPTRLELLRLRRRKALAEGIADILQKDLETLIVALIEHRQRAHALRTQLYEILNTAYSLFIETEMTIGTMKVREISLSASPTEFGIELSTTPGVLGIPFPSLHFIEEENRSLKPRFNLLETPIQLEDAVSKVKDALKHIVKLAELTAAIREILEMISLKRRQINRIRFQIIPQLDATIRYVELILEEIERQDAIRVRVLQRKRKERAAKSV
jgi:V/A-type H+-transporting ATPase subunit D